MVVFALFVSYKLVDLIKKLNNILQQVFEKMKKPKKEWKYALFCEIFQVNS